MDGLIDWLDEWIEFWVVLVHRPVDRWKGLDVFRLCCPYSLRRISIIASCLSEAVNLI